MKKIIFVLFLLPFVWSSVYSVECHVNKSKKNLVKSLGADHVIDYKKEDFTKNGKKYDVIFDVVPNSSKSKCKDSLTAKGMYLTTLKPTKESAENLAFLVELAETKKISPIVNKIFPLDQIVEAHKYVESGNRNGHVIINVNP